MSTTTKQYTPTATARPNWRQREAQKERQQREAAAKAAEDERAKSFANTEENFPTTMKTTDSIRVHGGPSGKFLELANKLQVDEEAIRQAKKARRQRIAYDPNLFIRSGRRLNYEEDDDYASTVVEDTTDLNEKYPPHGKRGTYSAPDYEGFRTVTKKTKKVKRELTEAELQKKYREEFFGEGAEGEEDADMNAELAESNQRREFY